MMRPTQSLVFAVVSLLLLLLSPLVPAAKRKKKKTTVSPRLYLTDEEHRSLTLPDRFLCQGCKAIAWEFDRTFHAAETSSRRPRRDVGRRLSELSDPGADDAAEEACSYAAYARYGLKRLRERTVFGDAGTLVLSGPGTIVQRTKGIEFTGGVNAVRMAKLCRDCAERVGGYDEVYELYVRYATGRPDATAFARELCVATTELCTPDAFDAWGLPSRLGGGGENVGVRLDEL